jgi:hypothetical protein
MADRPQYKVDSGCSKTEKFNRWQLRTLSVPRALPELLLLGAHVDGCTFPVVTCIIPKLQQFAATGIVRSARANLQ